MSKDCYVYDNELRDNAGNVLATFSRHWAAVAAMIRLNKPDFRSLGNGDWRQDLEIERQLKATIGLTK